MYYLQIETSTSKMLALANACLLHQKTLHIRIYTYKKQRKIRINTYCVNQKEDLILRLLKVNCLVIKVFLIY